MAASLWINGTVAPFVFPICACGLTQIINQSLKIFFGRRRPGIITGKPRLYPIYEHVQKGFTVFESFPSGDSAQAGSFSAALIVYTGNPAWVVVALLAMFGRVYYWCHFVGDTLVGGSVGLFSGLFMGFYLVNPKEVGFYEYLIGNFIFIPSTVLHHYWRKEARRRRTQSEERY